MVKKYSVLIIGAGKIGAFFDQPKSPEVLTHAHAFSKHKAFNLIGFYDTDLLKAKKAALIWKTNAFKTINEAFLKNKVDVVCVTVPDEFHYKVLSQIAKYHPRIVFAEKPITSSLLTAQKIVNLYKKNNIPLLVNYSRRFVPKFREIKNDILKNKYGKFLSGTGYYGKGLFHNGSHIIDLLRLYLGEINKVKFIKSFKDFYKNDPSVSAVLTINKQQFSLKHVGCQNYTIFEIDLLFEKARIRMINSGETIEKYKVIDNPIIAGYKILAVDKVFKTSLNQALFFAADHIYDFLNKKTGLVCTAEEALMDLKSCSLIKTTKLYK